MLINFQTLSVPVLADVGEIYFSYKPEAKNDTSLLMISMYRDFNDEIRYEIEDKFDVMIADTLVEPFFIIIPNKCFAKNMNVRVNEKAKSHLPHFIGKKGKNADLIMHLINSRNRDTGIPKVERLFFK